MDESRSPKQSKAKARAASPLAALLARSALMLVAERLWRLGLALAALALFFLSLAWLGVFRAAPVEARMALVGAFAAVALFLVVREILRGVPYRREALARLDAGADPALRPAASYDDTLAQTPAPETAALWALHRKRLEAALARAPVAPPDPRTPARDPYALRALALIAAIAAGFVAGDEKRLRLAAAFDWRSTHLVGDAARIDAWLDPPAYTGRPPIVLARESAEPIAAPVGALLRLRPTDARISVDGGLVASAPGEAAASEQTFKLAADARLDLPDGRRFALTAIPDRAPTVVLTGTPRNNSRGSMTLAYRADDDYGVVFAEAAFARPQGGRRALYDPPRLPLTAPSSGNGDAKATLDLADSPYAGTRLTLRLLVRDAAGNDGASEPVETTLPQRRFVKPLARALAEQRRALALDPEARANVRAALEALALAPEVFDMPSSIHLGLRAARRSLDGPHSDDDLRNVADMLWAMALSLEEGDLSQAERDLREAERALREAMARGDSEEEIARRGEDMRAALDKFLQQLGARAGQNPERPPQESAGDNRSVTPDDLQAMLDEMTKAMQSGDMARAQQMLDELQDIMENLQTAQGGAGKGQHNREMSRALGEIDQLSREEQQLRDETYQGSPSGEQAQRERQRALRERLERQQETLRRGGGDSGEELDDARKAMKEAEEALGRSGGERGERGSGRDKAVDAQGRAVQALRKGADKLARQMRGEGDESAEEQGEQPGQRSGRGRDGRGKDPLGRNNSGRGSSARNRYDPLGLPPAQRAHRLQEELRRRLGQPERPQEELDYLQRLLRR